MNSLNSGAFNVLNNVESVSRGQVTTSSYALFAQSNWHVNERVDLTTGVRATHELKKGNVYRLAPTGGTPLPAGLEPVRNGQAGAWNSGDLKLSDWSPSGLVTLSWRPSDTHLLYATISRGEKSGGFNINGVGPGPALGADALEVAPEKATNYELGFKSNFWQQRLQVNGNLFLTRVRDYQAAAVITPPGGATPVQVLTNAGEVESRGVEWDIRARLSRALTFTFNGAYTDAFYKSFENAPAPAETNAAPPASYSLTGEQVQGAPRWIVNAGADYRWNWSGSLAQRVNINYAWRSEAPGNIDNSIYSELPAYGLLNVSTGLEKDFGKGVLDASLWVRNLLDAHYLQAGGSTVNAAYTGAPGTPRTIGATLRYSF